jgi:lipoate-protein ligase B
MPILRHLHLPNLTTYAHASHLQEILVSRLLRYKAAISKPSISTASSPSSQTPQPPPPTILTFTPHPIYTTGRRETSPPSPAQLEFLKQPLQTEYGLQAAEFTQALRGGQITFHGPGQLVIYPIISLAHPYSFSSAPSSSPASPASIISPSINDRKNLSPRCYVHVLETSTINTLAQYGVNGRRTENPGVWVDEDTKIAALGVHLRRNVTSHGVGLNVSTDLRWFGRIVACGLEGKGVTSMREEIAKAGGKGEGGEERGMSVEDVAGVWVGCFARECGLGEGDLVRVTKEDILAEGDGEVEGDCP